MFILNSTEDNLVAVLYKLLRLNKYRIAHSELKVRLKTHPDYPTLYSVKDLLEWLSPLLIGVIDKPFLSHMKKQFERNSRIGVALSNEDLKNHKGGANPPNCTPPKARFACECDPACVGGWYGCYTSQAVAEASLTVWCSCLGGKCRQDEPFAN
ncbi:MAG: hypothetical protein J7L96_09345 [Bacteroidales bacterium]|nr:hypothetical protein [Bacteroidales bacterium]